MARKKEVNKTELKSVKITEPVHSILKVHVAKKKSVSLIEFADKAIMNQIKRETKS